MMIPLFSAIPLSAPHILYLVFIVVVDPLINAILKQQQALPHLCVALSHFIMYTKLHPHNCHLFLQHTSIV